jgi:hypothetical protein
MIELEPSELTAVQIVGSICEKDKKTNREKILAWEDKAKDLPQVDIPVTHHIHGGMYGREITIPKGTILTGQIYKFDHFDIMISGDITVSTDSAEVKRLTGFNIFKGLSGKKRAGYAHEDTRWVTFHPYIGVDGDEIQKQITVNDFQELEFFHTQINKIDYLDFVASTGMTQEEIRKQVENTDDMLTYNTEFNDVYIDDSIIEGKGLFSGAEIKEGAIICKARIGGFRTPAGRYANHAVFPNAKIELDETNCINFIAVKDISKDEEITVNYRNVLNHRLGNGDLCQE